LNSIVISEHKNKRQKEDRLKPVLLRKATAPENPGAVGKFLI
jgi:hypothetical protein